LYGAPQPETGRWVVKTYDAYFFVSNWIERLEEFRQHKIVREFSWGGTGWGNNQLNSRGETQQNTRQTC